MRLREPNLSLPMVKVEPAVLDEAAGDVDQVAHWSATAPGPVSDALETASNEFEGWWLGRAFGQLDDAWVDDFRKFGGNLMTVADTLRTAAGAYRDGDDVNNTTFWFLR